MIPRRLAAIESQLFAAARRLAIATSGQPLPPALLLHPLHDPLHAAEFVAGADGDMRVPLGPHAGEGVAGADF